MAAFALNASTHSWGHLGLDCQCAWDRSTLVVASLHMGTGDVDGCWHTLGGCFGMDLGSLIESHGYWVLALGCLLEGETLLALAGFAAHRGHLELGWVIAVAAVAGFAGDQMYFWLGRRHGPAVLARFPSVSQQTDRLHRLIDRYHIWVIVGVRFAYGLRIAGPILIGSSPVSAARFARFNAIGAALWAAIVAALGWTLGHAVEAALGDIRHIEGWILLGLVAIAGLIWWARHARAPDVRHRRVWAASNGNAKTGKRGIRHK